jgi:non-heme chloroperoxidase
MHWILKRVLSELDIKDAVIAGFSMGGSIAIRYVSEYNGAHVSKLALCGAAAPIWTQRKDFPYNLPQSAVDDLIKLNNKDRPKLLSDFAKIFSATETSLNEGIGSWLKWNWIERFFLCNGTMFNCLRDTDLRSDLKKIKIPTLIMHGKKDKICSFDLAGQMKLGISRIRILLSLKKAVIACFWRKLKSLIQS